MLTPWIMETFSRDYRQLVSVLIHNMSQQPCDVDLTLDVIRSTQKPIFSNPKNHTHPKAAVLRSQASAMAHSICLKLGKQPYFEQMNRADQRRGVEGSRSFYWSADLALEPKLDSITPDHIPVMIDVDYYTDMNCYLLNVNQIVLLYTFQPTAAGRATEEYKYSFDEDLVTYHVSGGATYTHEVWSYQDDFVDVQKKFCGVLVQETCFRVERVQMDIDHQLVCLIPVRKCGFLSSLLVGLLTRTNPLHRLKLADGEYNRLKVQTPDGLLISTSIKKGFSAVTIPVSSDEAILNSAKITKSIPITVPTVKFLLSQAKIDVENVDIITGYARLMETKEMQLVNRVNEVPTYTYEYINSEYNPGDRPVMIPYMNRFSKSSFVPINSVSNQVAMIHGRVTKFPVNFSLNENILCRISQFVSCLIPKELARTFHPVDIAEVYRRQPRPTQQSILNRGELSPPKPNIETFPKAEPYVKITHLRNISVPSAAVKRDYSTFIYVLNDYLKDYCSEWYAFGKDPKAIAEMVTNMCMKAIFNAVLSDGSRWDGHVGIVFRMLDLIILLTLFHPKYHAAIMKMNKSVYGVRGKTSKGVDYESGFTQGSGLPDTAGFNSIRCRFVTFNADMDAGLTPEQAYSKPSANGGDDGLTIDLDPELLQKAAAYCGQDYEAEERIKGQPVEFLSRIYTPKVWFGEQSSVCSIDRSAGAFPLTKNIAATAEEKLIEKSRSYYLSDRNTAVIGPIVTAVERIVGPGFFDQNFKVKSISGFWSLIPIERQYPNNVTFEECLELGLSPEFDHAALVQYCSQATTLKEILEIPCFDNRDLEVIPPNVIVNGEICSTIDPSTMVERDDIQSVPCKAVAEFQEWGNAYATGTISGSELVEAISIDSKPSETSVQKIQPPTYTNKDVAYHISNVLKDCKYPDHLYVLDIGSGSGRRIAALVRIFFNIVKEITLVALEPDLARANEISNNLRLIDNDQFHWQLHSDANVVPGYKFDLVFCLMTLHHIQVDNTKPLLELLLRHSTDVKLVVREHDATPENVEVLHSLHPTNFASPIEKFYSLQEVTTLMNSLGLVRRRISNYPKATNPMFIYTALFVTKPVSTSPAKGPTESKLSGPTTPSPVKGPTECSQSDDNKVIPLPNKKMPPLPKTPVRAMTNPVKLNAPVSTVIQVSKQTVRTSPKKNNPTAPKAPSGPSKVAGKV